LIRSVETKRAALVSGLLTWWCTARREYPWRRRGVTPYEVLLAEVLLKRTTARSAERAFPRFLEAWPDVKALLRATDDDLTRALSTVGLQRQRTKTLKDVAWYISLHEGGRIPDTLEGLSRIPHIGPYTARAVLSFAYDIPVAVVDSNVVRVIGRLFSGVLAGRPAQNTVQAVADMLIPKESHREFNYAVLDFGALVCRYTNPRCSVCPVKGQCDYVDQEVCDSG